MSAGAAPSYPGFASMAPNSRQITSASLRNVSHRVWAWRDPKPTVGHPLSFGPRRAVRTEPQHRPGSASLLPKKPSGSRPVFCSSALAKPSDYWGRAVSALVLGIKRRVRNANSCTDGGQSKQIWQAASKKRLARPFALIVEREATSQRRKPSIICTKESPICSRASIRTWLG
jgi:hypothetical protein